MRKDKETKRLGCKEKTHVNIIGFGLKLEPGRFYGVSWFSQGGFDFNEMCFIPHDEKDPERYFRKWLDEILMYVTLPSIDIQVKPMEI